MGGPDISPAWSSRSSSTTPTSTGPTACLLHHRALCRRLHRVHHLSNNPTPRAACSFDVGEAFARAGIVPLLIYAIPMHHSAFFAFMTWQITFNVFGHRGFEIYLRWFLRTWPGKVLDTPTHHARHHEKLGANFGLYFNLRDRLLGTNHPDDEARFARVTDPTCRDDPPFAPILA